LIEADTKIRRVRGEFAHRLVGTIETVDANFFTSYFIAGGANRTKP